MSRMISESELEPIVEALVKKSLSQLLGKTGTEEKPTHLPWVSTPEALRIFKRREIPIKGRDALLYRKEQGVFIQGVHWQYGTLNPSATRPRYEWNIEAIVKTLSESKSKRKR